MALWKMPPKAKIYEAVSAVADGRVKIVADGKAEVVSSTGGKTYIVEWSPDISRITSNDNASYWQGYLGYPIIAVLCLLGKLDYDKSIAAHLSGILWKKLNTQYRNDYSKAIDQVLTSLKEQGINSDIIIGEVDRIMEQLGSLKLDRLPKRTAPPKEPSS